MTFTRPQVGLLMRALLRSLPDTPPRERRVHKAVYDKLSEEIVRLTPRRTTQALGRAVDRMIGR